MDILLYAAAGALVGLIVGLTGIGGGSLMTPILLTFGIPPHIAVGTDLLYAAITKSSGAFAHFRQKTIRWSICLLMLAGSIPTALLTGYLLKKYFGEYQHYTSLITTSLGIMLIITATLLLMRGHIQRYSQRHATDGNNLSSQHKAALTIIMGVFLGFFVTISSVGAGAIGTAILLVLYPQLKSIKVVGTDIAHAVPLTLTGGLVHLSLGNVDYGLLFALLLGSLPAIHLGTKLGNRLPDALLRPALATLLAAIGAKYIFF